MDRQIKQDHSLQEINSQAVTVAVIGASHTALQTAFRLVEQNMPVQIFCTQAEALTFPELPVSIEVKAVPHLYPALLPEILGPCQRAVVTSDDEHFNLHVTLTLQACFPEMRIVTRLFNLALGREIESRFPQIRVLSVSELAAPHFVAAAFTGSVQEAWQDSEHLLARMETGSGPQTQLISVREFPPPPSGRARKLRTERSGLRFDPLLLAVLFGLAGVIGSGSLFFWLRHGMPLGDALYFVVTTLTTTGYGDYSLRELPFSAKLAGMALMLAGGSLFAVLFALLTDKLFRLRLEALLGQRQVRASGHVIVCGAGDVGVRLAECLNLTGVKTVMIERNPEGRFNARVRDLGAALLIGDATLEDNLRKAGIERARALICATDQDLRNLEMALNARALNPAIRIVVRIYERDFAEHMRAHFGIDVALSSSALASQAFAREAMKDIEI